MIPSRILLATISFLISTSALAGHFELAWDPNSEPDLAGYRIYCGTSSRNYTTCVDVGNATSGCINGLSEDIEYFLGLTAYDLHGNESEFSGEVSGFALQGEGSCSATTSDSSLGGGCFIKAADNTFNDPGS